MAMLPLAKAPSVCGVLWTVKPPGWQLTAVCIPVPHVTATLGILSLVLFTLPLFNFFSFLAYHSFAFLLEVCRGNQRRLKHNKNHLHLSQALATCLSSGERPKRKLLAKIRAQTRSVDHL